MVRLSFWSQQPLEAPYARCGISAKPVIADRKEPLAGRLAALGVREGDIEESFVHSGGPGGQNVNKVATCVMLLHVPTGVTVKCQATRHQSRNREMARRLLVEKLESRRNERAAAEQARSEKRRRQTRTPSAAAKKRNLQAKSHRAGIKAARRGVRPE